MALVLLLSAAGGEEDFCKVKVLQRDCHRHTGIHRLPCSIRWYDWDRNGKALFLCTSVISTDPNTRIIISSSCWAITAVPSYRCRNPSSHHDIALKLAKWLEIHFTLKHGSWLNIAEIEPSAMTKQCLDKRIATIEELQTQVSAWESKRTVDTKSVDWQFSTDDARIKTNRLLAAKRKQSYYAT
jgi:hypothetical protein